MAKAVRRPLVSIVMTIFNSERYLHDAIDSILKQTFTDFEFIIVDDGSKDGSADIVRSYGDDRICFVRQENAGLPAALNAGIRIARGEVIARMDPDDISNPDRLAKQYAYLLEHQDVALVGTGATYMEENGRPLANVHMPSLYDVGNLPLPETPCIHPSVMFRKSAFEKAGGYPEKMKYGGEDAVLFNKMLLHARVANLSEPLLLYRLRPGSMSQKSLRYVRLLREMVRKCVMNEYISTHDWEKLAEEYASPGCGMEGYYVNMGKILLRTEDARRARGVITRAWRLSPLSVDVWRLLLASCLPLKVRKIFMNGMNGSRDACY